MYVYMESGLRPMPPPCVGCGSEPHGGCLGTRGWSPGGLWDAGLGPLGDRFGDSWGLFWASWGPPGASRSLLGPSRGHPGPSRATLGPSWAVLGAIIGSNLGRFGPLLGSLDAFLGRLGGLMGSCWLGGPAWVSLGSL